MRSRSAQALIVLATALACTVDPETRQGGARDEESRHADAAGAKTPMAEVLHCPLAFAGVHLQQDRPGNAQVAYHFCKPLNDDVSQCLLYEAIRDAHFENKMRSGWPEAQRSVRRCNTRSHGILHPGHAALIAPATQGRRPPKCWFPDRLDDGTGPNARLIGIDYLVSDSVYRAMPEEKRAYWHDHKYEVDARMIRSLTQSGDKEAATLVKVRTIWGKVYHTWASGKTYPEGPAKLFWSVTGVALLVLPACAKLPPELERHGVPGRP